MVTLTLSERTTSLIDELLSDWQTLTKTEDSQALVARSAVNALLDLRSFATEFDEQEAILHPAKA